MNPARQDVKHKYNISSIFTFNIFACDLLPEEPGLKKNFVNNKKLEIAESFDWL